MEKNTGLSSAEAEKRLKKFGFNEITELKKITWLHILLAQFKNIMVLILLAAFIISFLVNEYIDAIAIFVIVIINAIIGFIQEYRAEKTIAAMKKLAAPFAVVIRDGIRIKIPAKNVVPGDLIVMEDGASIPADAKLIETSELHVIESSLTGESSPVLKSTKDISISKSIAEMTNMVFLGTKVAKGHGLAIVTATGMDTEFGKIANMIESEPERETPMQKKLGKLSKMLAIFTAVLCLILFTISIVTGRDIVEMLLINISLAVSVIPEGLPAIITLTLAIGVKNMAKKNALVRRISAAETLGSVSIICSDKTGTLTQNEMTVQKIYTNNTEFEVTGIGYEANGEVLMEGKKANGLQMNELLYIMTGSACCNNSDLILNEGKLEVSGDPTEACLLTLSKKAGIDPEETRKRFPRLYEHVFDSERKRMSTVNKIDKEFFLITKGAPDSVINICDKIAIGGKEYKLDANKKKELMAVNEKYAKNALRVLGFAYKRLKEGQHGEESNMVFLGLVAMMDPARPEAKIAIEKCKSAGIDVVMITGDHLITAKAIGKEIGIFKEGDKFMTGEELEKISAKELEKIVEKIKIYARVNPIHKVKILEALQNKGRIVAMTGDGVNDAPALKKADIGVAMGITGTDVSKEASDIILLNDNFATIVESVESGRLIYENIKKFIRFLLSSNFDELILIVASFIIGAPLPLLPLQILAINLLTDSLPALALGVDTKDKDIMQKKPRNPKTSIFKELISFSLIAGIISAAVGLFIYLKYYQSESIEYARTMVFTSAVIFEMLLVFSVRYENRNYFVNFFTNKFLLMGVSLSLAIQALIIYSPMGNKIFSTVALSLKDIGIIFLASALGILVLEIYKLFKHVHTNKSAAKV